MSKKKAIHNGHLRSEYFNQLRREYGWARLEEQNLLQNPISTCQEWIETAIKCQLQDANAMVISTVSPTGQPSSRVVLLKDVGADGFTFFTHYGSAKAEDIKNNDAVSLLFFWIPLERQLRVTGRAVALSTDISDAYFATRSRNSQLSAWISSQSCPISSKKYLEKEKKSFELRFKQEENIPRPPHWGGYLVRPQSIEFWQGRTDRLHDRVLYQKQADGTWAHSWLAP